MRFLLDEAMQRDGKRRNRRTPLNRQGDRKSDTDTETRTRTACHETHEDWPTNNERRAKRQRERERERDDQKETMNDWPNARGRHPREKKRR